VFCFGLFLGAVVGVHKEAAPGLPFLAGSNPKRLFVQPGKVTQKGLTVL